MAKRVVIVLVLGVLLGLLSMALSFSLAPDLLPGTMCPAGATFVSQEGQTEMLPDGQFVAPLSMRCVAADGSVSEARVALAMLAHAGLFSLLWMALVAWAVSRLVASLPPRR